MGRQLRRVPLDFDWPQDQIWEGFVCPIWVPECTECKGHGRDTSFRALERWVSLLLLLGDDSVRGRLHPYFHGTPITTAGTTMHEVTVGLAGRKPSLFGHDACDTWTASKKVIAAAGLSEDWGTCEVCGGNGYAPGSEALLAAEEAWEPTEPPEGEGWQLWETVSEGSPISPVYGTPEALARYLVDHPWGVDKGSSFESWMRFLEGPGWAPSMVATVGPGGVDIKTGPCT